jgi:hypothetical protein
MTGGHGALPIFVDFMKDFMKGKEKEQFEKAPGMPEDMKELFKQRQHEIAEERADLAAKRGDDDDEDNSTQVPSAITDTKPGQVTMPPPPKGEDDAPPPPRPVAEPSPRHLETTLPRTEGTTAPAATSRPREVEPPKKKGKKGNDEP